MALSQILPGHRPSLPSSFFRQEFKQMHMQLRVMSSQSLTRLSLVNVFGFFPRIRRRLTPDSGSCLTRAAQFAPLALLRSPVQHTRGAALPMDLELLPAFVVVETTSARRIVRAARGCNLFNCRDRHKRATRAPPKHAHHRTSRAIACRMQLRDSFPRRPGTH